MQLNAFESLAYFGWCYVPFAIDVRHFVVIVRSLKHCSENNFSKRKPSSLDCLCQSTEVKKFRHISMFSDFEDAITHNIHYMYVHIYIHVQHLFSLSTFIDKTNKSCNPVYLFIFAIESEGLVIWRMHLQSP